MIPTVKMRIKDGALGVVPGSTANAEVKVGIAAGGTVGVLAGFGDIDELAKYLVAGPLLDAAGSDLEVAGGSIYVLPVNPTTFGSASGVTQVGTGTGTIAVSVAPRKQILIKITTGGALATMAFAYSVDGEAYSAPVLSTVGGGASNPFLVPKTLTRITFPVGVYVLNEVYTVATDGTVSQTGAGPLITQASSPIDSYNVDVQVMTAGGLGVGAFRYSLDDAKDPAGAVTSQGSWSQTIAIPGGGGKFVIDGAGIVLTFSGTFVLDDLYSFTTTGPSFSTSDLAAALTLLAKDSRTYGFIHVVGQASSAANAASVAATVDTQMTAFEAKFRYTWALVECPTTEPDATVAAAFASFASSRVNVCAGDILHDSPVTGKKLRRNCAWVVSSRTRAVQEAVDPAWVELGGVSQVAALFRDEAATEGLDVARFTTMRTHTDFAGYYVTSSRMMATPGSDFTYAVNRRVMDTACRITRLAELPFLNGNVRVNAETGYIDERDALAFERLVAKDLENALVATGQASAAFAVVSRTVDLLSTSVQPVSVRVVPKAYMRQIDTTIGFFNPAA